MDLLDVLILSIVEGLSEFLPISSTGHLVLASKILNITQTDFVKSFEISIQLGAILAVVALYGRTILIEKKIWLRVLGAFIPTGILGFLLYGFIKRVLLGNEAVTLAALFIGGIFIILFEKLWKPKEEKTQLQIKSMSLRQAVLIGIFQSFSMIPGVSRAAATIFGGMILGLDRRSAVEFSFLLAIPTMLAATSLDLIKSDLAFTGEEYLLLAVGFMGTFTVALITVKYFLKFVQTHTFVPFGVYRIILAVLFWIVVR
ncbi:MAG: undecaprenyl-diphosphatase UppP [Candidatus Blackburnbacteria bacterium]|nr:undecaprenyl-diphosphatase UppP [Candidatus Blackburnbacteria bacterium]